MPLWGTGPAVDERALLADQNGFAKRLRKANLALSNCGITSVAMDQPTNDAAASPTGAATNTLPTGFANAPRVSHALFRIGDKVQHRTFGFRGVVFDVDPVFANSEEWYESNPLQPDRNQPFYHLLADNGEQSYVAYVSQQNLMTDDGSEPIDHPAIAMMFKRLPDGDYKLDSQRWN